MTSMQWYIIESRGARKIERSHLHSEVSRKDKNCLPNRQETLPVKKHLKQRDVWDLLKLVSYFNNNSQSHLFVFCKQRFIKDKLEPSGETAIKHSYLAPERHRSLTQRLFGFSMSQAFLLSKSNSSVYSNRFDTISEIIDEHVDEFLGGQP